MAKWQIYALKDPTTEAVKYIGAAENAQYRLYQHIERSLYARYLPVNLWILELLKEGKEPELLILESGEGSGRLNREKFWLAHYKQLGAALVNVLGFTSYRQAHRRGPLSTEDKQRLAKATKASWARKRLSGEDLIMRARMSEVAKSNKAHLHFKQGANSGH